ncbi:MAG: cohesin domain-containing protein [Candidatus Latescibacterota bacterium]
MKTQIITNHMKFFMCIGLLILFGISGCGPSPLEEKHSEFNFRIFPSNLEIEKGKETYVSVWVDEADKLIATRFTISFDPSYVEVATIYTSGAEFMFSDAGADIIEIENCVDNTRGTLTVGISAHQEAFTGVSGNGKLAEFVIKGIKVGQTNLQFVDNKPDDIVSAVYSTKSKTGWEEKQIATFNSVVIIKEPKT